MKNISSFLTNAELATVQGGMFPSRPNVANGSNFPCQGSQWTGPQGGRPGGGIVWGIGEKLFEQGLHHGAKAVSQSPNYQQACVIAGMSVINPCVGAHAINTAINSLKTTK